MSLVGKPWSPSISTKQAQVLQDRRRFLLLSGPRWSTKTIGGLHDLALHAWETPGASISMIGRTTTDNADGGAWMDLHRIVFPEWFAGGFGFRYVKPPKLDGATHKIVCTVTNKHGGETRIQLDSLDNEREVDHKFKGKRYSMIYIPELSNFKSRYCFDVWQECLRMPHLEALERKSGQNIHRFIGDTNPSDEGEDSWIYKLWYEDRTSTFEDEPSAVVRHAKKLLAKQFSLHEFTIDDNIWATEDQKILQLAKYEHNQDLHDRFYLGLWKRASGNGVFADVWRPNIHIPKMDRDQMLLPEETCSELGSGWDIGGANNAAVIVEPVSLANPVTGAEEFSFKVLDEFVMTDRNISVEEVTESMVEKIDFWERQLACKVLWQHVSDRSAFDRFDNIGDTYEYKEVFRASDGRVELVRGPIKKRGSVQARVNMVRKLLHNNRLWVSPTCVGLIDCLNSIKKGNTSALDPKSRYKHVFDALTYYICLKCYAEMEREIRNIVGVPEKPENSVLRINL